MVASQEGSLAMTAMHIEYIVSKKLGWWEVNMKAAVPNHDDHLLERLEKQKAKCNITFKLSWQRLEKNPVKSGYFYT